MTYSMNSIKDSFFYSYPLFLLFGLNFLATTLPCFSVSRSISCYLIHWYSLVIWFLRSALTLASQYPVWPCSFLCLLIPLLSPSHLYILKPILLSRLCPPQLFSSFWGTWKKKMLRTFSLLGVIYYFCFVFVPRGKI